MEEDKAGFSASLDADAELLAETLEVKTMPQLPRSFFLAHLGTFLPPLAFVCLYRPSPPLARLLRRPARKPVAQSLPPLRPPALPPPPPPPHLPRVRAGNRPRRRRMALCRRRCLAMPRSPSLARAPGSTNSGRRSQSRSSVRAQYPLRVYIPSARAYIPSARRIFGVRPLKSPAPQRGQYAECGFGRACMRQRNRLSQAERLAAAEFRPRYAAR